MIIELVDKRLKETIDHSLEKLWCKDNLDVSRERLGVKSVFIFWFKKKYPRTWEQVC